MCFTGNAEATAAEGEGVAAQDENTAEAKKDEPPSDEATPAV